MEFIKMKLTKRKVTLVTLVILSVVTTLLVGVLPVAAADSPMLHNSLRFPATTKHGGAWGIPGAKYGEFSCGTCHAKNTGNIKRILKTFVAPNSPTDQFPIEADGTPPVGGVSFMDIREGSSDFGDDARAVNDQSTNVCEVCHTYDPSQTVGVKFHGYDMSSLGDSGHYNRADCMICHPHSQGFKPQACDSCHGYPPIDTSAGGTTGLANNPYSTGSATAGAHQKHAIDLGYACTNCHDSYNMPQESAVNTGFGDISIGFNNFSVTTGSYTGQVGVSYNDAFGTGGENCSNVYCHSNGQSADGTSATPSAYSSPSWSGAAACGTCHSATDPATGAHSKHIVDGATCDTCHAGSTHVDRVIDVTSGAYTAGGAPGNGYGSCSTASCHDQGRGGLATTPNWGTNVTDCSECHASAPTTGGHTVHLAASIAGSAIACSDCHDAATDPATETEPAVGHRDTDIDVSVGSYPTNKAKDSAFTTCSTATCHQTGQAVNDYTVTSNWDIDDANCTQCHAASPTTNSHSKHIAVTSDCATCHTNAVINTTYNDAAHGDLNIDVAVGGYTANKALGSALESCSINCHSDGMAATGTSPTWGTVGGACDVCHLSDMVTGSHGPHLTDGATCGDCHNGAVKDSNAGTAHTDGNVDVVATYATANAAYGAATWTTCSAASCHDDGRAPNVTAAWGTTVNNCAECHATQPATGSHTVHLADGATCGNCHTGSVEGTTAPTANHRDGNVNAGSGYPVQANGSAFTNCSTATCHNDGRNSGVTQNWGTTVNNCAECHETSPTTFAHNKHLSATILTTISCSTCHTGVTEGTTAGAGHRDGNIDTVAGFGYTADKGLGTATTTCATSYCHGDNMPLGTTSGITNAPNWNATSTGCNFCHDMAPAAIGAHAGKGPTDCITCHNHTNAAGDGFTNASLHINGIVENDADSCTTCHSGDIDGVLAGSHNSHVDIATFLSGKTVSGNNYGDASWYTTTYTNGVPSFGCGQCHPDSEGTSHPINGLNVDIAQKAATNIKEKNNASVGMTITSRTTVTCSSVYCHSDGQATATYKASPDWYGQTVSGNCNDCHDNGPASGTHANHVVGIHYETLYDGTAGLMASGAANGAAHGDSTTADTIGCQSCHNNTVAVEYNSSNSVCTTCHAGATGAPAIGDEKMVINTLGSTHVNGSADVVFDNFASFKSKAQVRDDITTAAELNANWTRTNGYKAATSFDQAKVATPSYAGGSCSNVSCHNGIATPTWNTGFVGNCRACHTTLP
jgi:predicted CxxxxCH...CXXCH cytochrome family protein